MKIYDYNGKKNICGSRVREARKALKLKQSELAAKLQTENVLMERDVISRIEIGTRFVSDYELMVLSQVLGVSMEWLVGKE